MYRGQWGHGEVKPGSVRSRGGGAGGMQLLSRVARHGTRRYKRN